MAERSQHSNILLAFISLTAVIVIVSLIGFFTLGKGPEIIQGQAEADEYRVSSKVPGRIIRKTKCFDFWERNVLFPKTKRSFFRTPTLPFSA